MTGAIAGVFLSLVTTVAAAAPDACDTAAHGYEAAVGRALVLNGMLARFDTDRLATPEGREVARQLFAHHEQVARQVRAVILVMRSECRARDGFAELDAELRRIEPTIEKLENESRHLQILLDGGIEM
ncbi:hypothetical protein L6Q96_21810 [Candidatus Binatia bacterium]|nr:hypothetical protein [Candidatus Binatia bacterium]